MGARARCAAFGIGDEACERFWYAAWAPGAPLGRWQKQYRSQVSGSQAFSRMHERCSGERQQAPSERVLAARRSVRARSGHMAVHSAVDTPTSASRARRTAPRQKRVQHRHTRRRARSSPTCSRGLVRRVHGCCAVERGERTVAAPVSRSRGQRRTMLLTRAEKRWSLRRSQTQACVL